MKKYLILALTVALSLIICPLGVYTVSGFPLEENLNREDNHISSDSLIKVFKADTGKVTELNFRDYIIGVVAAEMPAEFHPEALSALAAAAATLARKSILEGEDSTLSGAVISTDPKIHQAYMTTEEMHEKWGSDFEKYYNKIAEATDKSLGYSITYEGELITAAYHAMSTGITESAENVWSGNLPYLVEVKSEGDCLSPKYETVCEIPVDEFREKLVSEGSVFSDDVNSWVKNALYTKAGTLKSVTIGEKSYQGDELREIFSLRSAAIGITVTDTEVIFSVKGYGHGVGMSQYGADYYARQGMTWQEIIKHYYTGVEIESTTLI